MATYKGTFNNTDWYQVTKDGEPFDHLPSLEVVNHSPDGFAWGYGGSGPAQLAMAMLLDNSPRTIAEQFYIEFKNQIVACFPQEGFTFTSEEVIAWLEGKK